VRTASSELALQRKKLLQLRTVSAADGLIIPPTNFSAALSPAKVSRAPPPSPTASPQRPVDVSSPARRSAGAGRVSSKDSQESHVASLATALRKESQRTKAAQFEAAAAQSEAARYRDELAVLQAQWTATSTALLKEQALAPKLAATLTTQLRREVRMREQLQAAVTAEVEAHERTRQSLLAAKSERDATSGSQSSLQRQVDSLREQLRQAQDSEVCHALSGAWCFSVLSDAANKPAVDSTGATLTVHLAVLTGCGPHNGVTRGATGGRRRGSVTAGTLPARAGVAKFPGSTVA
jgi:hypothetical protein